MSKFHKYCFCIICKIETTTQSIKSHYTKYHTTPTPRAFCKECQSPIYSTNTFCNTSCAAIFNNRKRAESGWTQTEKQRQAASRYGKLKRIIPYTKITQCVICHKFHKNSGKTCSTTCFKIHLSSRIRESIASGIFNPQKNRGRSKRSYMEYSFELWINHNYESLPYITEQPFSRHDIIKTYFVDFYFPSLNLIIELDGSQHLKTIEYDKDRDDYISSTYNLYILRISHSEYKNKSKLELVKKLLSL